MMPVSSQALYFHLGMNADDDGFIQPKIVMRTTGANDDDLKVLLTKRFLLAFESGVVVVKHWLIHNLIQKDRYHPTRFQEEKKVLIIKDNKAYSDSVNKMLPEVRLGKVSIGKVITAKAEKEEPQEDIQLDENYLEGEPGEATPSSKEVIRLFKAVNPAWLQLWKRKTEHQAALRMLKIHPFEWWLDFMPKYAIAWENDKFMPRADKPTLMEGKIGTIELHIKSSIKSKKPEQKIWI